MAVVDGVVTAVGARHFSLGIGRHRANHGQPQQFCPLRNDQANTTCRGMQQHGVARLEGVDPAHQVGGGQAPHGHGRRGFATDCLRQLDQRRRGDQPLGAVGAQRVDEAGIGHTVADRQMGDAGTDGLDHAGGLVAEAAGQRNLISAAAEVSIGKIQAHGHVAYADLPRSRLTNADVLEAKDLGSACFVKPDGFCHVVSCSLSDTTAHLQLAA
ncbi:hypothetical protein D9M68_576100 [compost metagenome]